MDLIGCGRMQVGAANYPESARTGVWRLVATWLVLLAFALQSYVTQSHVHRAPFAAQRATITQVIAALPDQAASSVDPVDEAIACPFCQAIAAAGAFHGLAAVALKRLMFSAMAADQPPAAVGGWTRSAGFSWRSRAPPHS